MSSSRQGSRSGTALWALVPLAVLVFAGWQTVAMLARTPAFNRALTADAPPGRRVPEDAFAYYDRASYRYWTAWLWYDRYRVAAFDAQWAMGGRLAALEAVAADALLRSRDLAYQSLAARPGDAASWMFAARSDMSLADMGLSERAVALDAYRTAFALAPHNSVLAAERILFLVRFMSTPDGWEIALASVDADMVQSDLETMKSRMGFLLRDFADAPAVRAILATRSDGA